jgi:hypothetical protein
MIADLFYSRAMIMEYDSVVAQLSSRAEDLTDLDGTFVETIFPEIMQVRGNQIIYGRRGAGKTHLLRRVEARLRETFPETGILPIYVNGSQLSQDISIVSSDPATGRWPFTFSLCSISELRSVTSCGSCITPISGTGL